MILFCPSLVKKTSNFTELCIVLCIVMLIRLCSLNFSYSFFQCKLHSVLVLQTLNFIQPCVVLDLVVPIPIYADSEFDSTVHCFIPSYVQPESNRR